MISDIQHLPGLGLSDHVCLKFALTCYGTYIHDNKPRYNLHQADFDRMRTLLEAIDWDDTLSSLDHIKQLSDFKKIFFRLQDTRVYTGSRFSRLCHGASDNF